MEKKKEISKSTLIVVQDLQDAIDEAGFTESQKSYLMYVLVNIIGLDLVKFGNRLINSGLEMQRKNENNI
jgi:hypothetical protein